MSDRPERAFRATDVGIRRHPPAAVGVSRKAVRPVVTLALFALALGVRALTWPTVFTRAGILPVEPDAYYHLRRIAFMVAHFPDCLRRDPYLNFPHGGEAIWTPFVDLALAAVVRLAAGAGDHPTAMERIVVWFPPLLGAATVVVLVRLVRRYCAESVAALSGVLLSLFPGHFWTSQLGFVDHHVAVAWIATLVVGATLRVLETEGAAGSGLGAATRLGVALAAAFLVWPGCLLHAGIAEMALGAHVVAAARREEAVRRARIFAVVHLVAAGALAPFSLGHTWARWGAVSPLVLSAFQPLWLGAGAVCFLLVSEVWGRAWFPPSRVDRVLFTCALAAATFGAVMSLVPDLGKGILDASDWFAKNESFQEIVAESTPLFWTPHGWDRSLPEAMFSRLVYAIPLMLAALGWSLRGRPGTTGWAFLWWTSALFVATLVQHRFMNCFSVAYAVLLAGCLLRGLAFARRRVAGRSPWTVGAGALALAGLAFAFQPLVGFYGHALSNLGRALRGEAAVPYGWGWTQVELDVLGRWLRKNTPETAGYLDPDASPEYGVLASWSHGHAIRYVARRPVVQDNFGDDVAPENFLLAEEYFAAREESTALRIAERLGVRFVVADRQGAGRPVLPGPDTVWAALYHPRVVWGPRRSGPGAPKDAPALVHHRLVYEYGLRSDRPPRFLVYEIVPGARVVGSAPPGANVVARLRMRTRHGRELEYEVRATARANGRYALTLPYSNELASPAVQTASAYELGSGGFRAELVVPEEAVRRGGTLDGPALGPRGGSRPEGSGLQGGATSMR